MSKGVPLPGSNQLVYEGDTGRFNHSLYSFQDGTLNSLDLNKDNTQVVIAGRHIFKVLRIEEDGFVERSNLRTGKHLNLNFSSVDVAWNLLDEQYVATAATNGSVCVWNIVKTARMKQEFVNADHQRTVNKVIFHYSDPALLLSASQDGTMKLFDFRKKELAITYTSSTESVRDVKFNPLTPHQFIAVTDSGTTQIWDDRRPDRAERQFACHSGPVFSCDLHPDFRHWFATAGRDRAIKFWNIEHKPHLEHTIWTIASVGRIKFRPQRKYHVASAALVVDCTINVWDARRPYVPYASFNTHRDICTGLAWNNDAEYISSTSKDTFLWKHSMEDAKRPAESASPVALAFGVRDDVAFATTEHAVSNVPPNVPSTSSVGRTMVGNFFGRMKSAPSEVFVNARSVFNLFGLEESPVAAEEALFVSLATNYVLTGKSFSEICDLNAAVARSHNKEQVALTWQVIKLMFESSSSGGSPSDQASQTGKEPGSKGEEHHSGPSGVTSGADSGDPERRSLRHFSGDRSNVESTNGSATQTVIALEGTSPGESTHADHNSDSDDADLHERNLFDIACGMGHLHDDVFYMGEIDFGAGYPNSLDGGEMDFARAGYHGGQNGCWTLPTEAFELKHDIVPTTDMGSMNGSLLGMGMNGGHGVGHFHQSQPNFEVMGKAEVKTGATEFLPESAHVPIDLGPLPRWDFLPIVAESLEHFAEQGDVQTAVTLLLVLGSKINNVIPETVQELWCQEYLELLLRHQLWNVATMVIRLATNLPHINTINNRSTMIHTACAKCHKPSKRAGWICDSCRDITNTCSICHQVVKGLFAWCQGCSHGGHLPHMTKWFSERKECPSGCGHLCEFT